MNSIDANIRNDKTKGELNLLRNNGDVPAIVYGGDQDNQKVYISKKLLKSFLEKETKYLLKLKPLEIFWKNQCEIAHFWWGFALCRKLPESRGGGDRSLHTCRNTKF